MEIKRYKSESDNKIDQLARTLKEQYPDMVFGEGSTFLLSLLLEQVKIVGERDAALTAVREEVEKEVEKCQTCSQYEARKRAEDELKKVRAEMDISSQCLIGCMSSKLNHVKTYSTQRRLNTMSLMQHYDKVIAEIEACVEELIAIRDQARAVHATGAGTYNDKRTSVDRKKLSDLGLMVKESYKTIPSEFNGSEAETALTALRKELEEANRKCKTPADLLREVDREDEEAFEAAMKANDEYVGSLEYQGNTVSYIASKAENYGNQLGLAHRNSGAPVGVSVVEYVKTLQAKLSEAERERDEKERECKKLIKDVEHHAYQTSLTGSCLLRKEKRRKPP